MPYYAVAIGKKIGVYKSWAECQNQTKGYPQAKFKKFDTEAQAKEFVNNNSIQNSTADGPSSSSMAPLMVENANPPEVKLLGKYGSQTMLKQDKFAALAEKLDNFIEETNKTLRKFGERLDRLETACLGTSNGKRKNDTEDGEEKKTAKKKKTIISIASLDEEGKTVVEYEENEDGDTVDGPWWNPGFSPPGGFRVGPDGYVIVFTDGACTNNGRTGARAGLGVWFNHNNPYNLAAPVEGKATNNNAEIQAATRAIQQANMAGIRRLNIHTDSKFMINCITDWIKKWKRNNWVTATGGAVKNKEQLQLLETAINSLDAVKWTHVYGHKGLEGNECADSLARSGAAM